MVFPGAGMVHPSRHRACVRCVSLVCRTGAARRGLPCANTHAHVAIGSCSDFDKARAAVDGDKTNFDSWAALLAVAESEVSDTFRLRARVGRCGSTHHMLVLIRRPPQDIAKVRATFDEFLERFPNCYGYWEKYAAAERRVGDAAGATAEQKAASQAASVAVYERAVAAVGSSPVSRVVVS